MNVSFFPFNIPYNLEGDLRATTCLPKPEDDQFIARQAWRQVSPQPQRSFVQLMQAAFGHAGRPIFDICKALEAELASARVSE